MTDREAFFDRVAAGGDALLFRAAEGYKVARLRARLGDLSGQRVLEPGCGAGPLTECLSDWLGPAGRVLAFDVSAGMVDLCRRRLGPRANVALRCADAATLELDNAAWDLAILFRVFPHFDDQPLIARRLRPCLAPGGRLVIAHFQGSAALNAMHAGHHAAVRRDRLPCARDTGRLLAAAGYRVTACVDEEDEYYVSAVTARERRRKTGATLAPRGTA